MAATEEQRFAGRPRPLSVALLDNEQIFRAALADALRDAGLEIVGQVGSAGEALELVVDARPDIVVMDLNLPGASGVKVIEQLTRLAPTSRILMLSHTEANWVVEAIIAGASGYILKSASLDAVVAAVIATAAGESVISSQVAGKLLQRIRARDIPITSNAQDAGDAIRAALTERELRIFSQLASGRTNREIAADLGLSVNTVSNHVASLLAKLHVDNRIQAAVQAVRSGIS